MQIEEHDPHHAVETDLEQKGLSKNSVGVPWQRGAGHLLGGTRLHADRNHRHPGHPAGSKMAVVIIAGFLPMFFAAYAYRELNKVAPDCGTSFTWTTKALDPTSGGSAVGPLFSRPPSCCRIYPEWRSNSSISSGRCLPKRSSGPTVAEPRRQRGDVYRAFAGATYVAYRGITTTEKVQFFLVGFQLIVPLAFAGTAIVKSGSSPTGIHFDWDVQAPVA